MTGAGFKPIIGGATRLVLAALAALGAAAPCAANQSAALAEYPTRAIRIIVASSPGTADDFFARSVAEDLAIAYKQRVLIDNKAGAGGLIGNKLVSKANADGYTLGMVSVTRIISELMRD